VRPNGADDHWALPTVPVAQGGWQVHPDWSHDGLQLAFTVDDADRSETRDLWVAAADGSNARRVVDCVAPCHSIDFPAWAPDDRSIAYRQVDELAGHVQDGSKLMVVDIASGKAHAAASTQGPTYIGRVRWAPEGERLVLSLDRWSDTSPDAVFTGTAIAVVDLRDSTPSVEPITDWTAWATYADWHPTKDLIVYSTRPWSDLETGPSNLYVVRPDGSHVKALTDLGPEDPRAVQPTWTPDGTRIIFTTVKGEGYGLPTFAMVNSDGTGWTSATGDQLFSGGHPKLRP
jgi:Tol biopolymer transport system component